LAFSAGTAKTENWAKLAGGMQYPTVTMVNRRFAKRLDADPALAKKIKTSQRNVVG
jgi:hypothetical protein